MSYTYNDLDQLQEEVEDVPDPGTDIYHSYFYDYNGSLRYKVYGSYANNSSTIVDAYDEYQYNNQQRLSAFLPDSSDAVAYRYNPQGIRVSKQIGSNNPISYLIDPQNATGYPQVFKQLQSGQADVLYIIGLDVLAQATGSSAPLYFLYDGHGSVRHLANSSGTVVDSYNYDAYGNALSFTPTDGLYYTGEMFDNNLGWYYNRDRYSIPSLGIFNQMDRFAGNNKDPQSLHKYLYCHANPVMNVDPSGQFSICELSMNIGMRIWSFNEYVGSYVTAIKPIIAATCGVMVIYDWYLGIQAGTKLTGYSISLLNANIPAIFHLGLGGGAELVVGKNQGAALYGFWGPTTHYGFGVSTANIGFLFNIHDSTRYEGRSRAISLSLGLIPSPVRSFIKKQFQTLLPNLHAAFLKRLPELNTILPSGVISAYSNALTKLVTLVLNENASITLWGGGSGMCGFSIAPGISSYTSSSFDAFTNKVITSYLFYEQAWPEDDEGKDIPVPF